MNNKFDELAKRLAQSVTRRQALKRFGVGLAGMALACLGLSSPAQSSSGKTCKSDADCYYGWTCCYGACVNLAYDVNNCGKCNHRCKHGGGEPFCVQGVCIYIL
jgi:hypothetical protein